MNPITAVRDLLALVPSKYRKAVYAFATLVGLGFTLWQASDGDWKQAAASFVATLVPAMAGSNVSPKVFNEGH